MIEYSKLCKVCVAIKDNTRLTKRIYNSTFYMPHSKDPLSKITRDCDGAFSYAALLNHCRKHQFMDEQDFVKRSLNKIAKNEERKIQLKRIKAEEVWGAVKERGLEALEKGELHVSVKDLLQATRDESSHSLKVKDQEMQMMEMVYYFASGENNESKAYDRRIIEGQAVTSYDITDRPPEDSDPGENRSSGVHYPPSWDATAPGPGEVPTGNDQ